jgi:hypothetical protein
MKHLIENTFLLFIIIIGGAGMAFSFVSNANETVKTSSFSTVNETSSKQPTFSENDWNSILKVRGIQETGAKLQFEVKSFNKNAHYLLDLGNGEKKSLKHKRQRYAYSNPGDFDLKLYVTYNGKTKLVHSETLNIEHEVVASSELPRSH